MFGQGSTSCRPSNDYIQKFFILLKKQNAYYFLAWFLLNFLSFLVALIFNKFNFNCYSDVPSFSITNKLWKGENCRLIHVEMG